MRYLSLFSGIEAASCAWEPLGWTPVAFAEIEPFPCSLLAQRFPGVPNLGDVTAITDEQIAALGHIDVVIGGSPCQDLSVAGKRAGLVGARSSLFHEQVRIFDAARTICGARWLVWENVPGAFSTHGGRDFARVVGDLAGCKLDVPGDGWGSEGMALGERGLVEWAVLDAQWFGLAQRRRRVFAVVDTGDWSGRSPVLLEPESLRGDHPPRREAREDVAGSVGTRIDRGGVNSEGGDGHLVAHTLSADGFDASEDGTGRGTPLVPDVAPTMRAGGNRTGGDRPPGTDVDTCESLVPEIVPQAMSAKWSKGTSGPDGDECANMIPIAFAQNQREEVRPLGVAGSLASIRRGDAKNETLIAFSAKDYGADATADVAPTLRAMHEIDGNANGGGQVAIAFDPCGAGKQTTLGANSSSSGSLGTTKVPGVVSAMQVRRLTPTECERLQGFPDGWTAITHRGKPSADGPRYRALGNSMAVPVIAWIGRRIAAVAG